MTPTLVDRIRAAAAELNAAAVDEEYRDPFWHDRYGQRGRRYALEDGQHHFNYVADAVAGGSPLLLARYARWLRDVLVARGMCSEHLADGFRIRARLLGERGWPDAHAAHAAFTVAEQALRYTEGPAAGLVPPHGTPTTRSVAMRTFAVPPAEQGHDARTVCSYLADALAHSDPQIFLAHLAWRRGFDDRRGRPAGYGAALLRVLAEPHDPASPPALLLARALETPR